jgi:hypothetical protein
MKLSSLVWSELSHNEQSSVIVDLYTACLNSGYCSSKGRKPIRDIQVVIQHKFGIVLDTKNFEVRVKQLLNKQSDNAVNQYERQQAMLRLLNSVPVVTA